MSDEATFRSELNILKDNLNYRSNPNDFRADVAIGKGPVPGAFTASVTGTDVDFSELMLPALCRIMNLDVTNFIEYGIWDGANFDPLGEVLPGEAYILRLSRNLRFEYGAGTGTVGVVNKLRVRSDTAACYVIVEAFDA
jgi:hypothetical protein